MVQEFQNVPIVENDENLDQYDLCSDDIDEDRAHVEAEDEDGVNIV